MNLDILKKYKKPKNRDHLKKLNFRQPYVWAATWFGCGLMRPAPGTWGTLGGLPFALILLGASGITALLIATILIIPLGYWASKEFEKATGKHDASEIVIDEVAGLWLTLLPAGLNPFLVFTGFILFRFFDVLKPWPVSWADKKLPGAWGVMVDDLFAGVYAGLCVWGIGYVIS